MKGFLGFLSSARKTELVYFLSFLPFYMKAVLALLLVAAAACLASDKPAVLLDRPIDALFNARSIFKTFNKGIVSFLSCWVLQRNHILDLLCALNCRFWCAIGWCSADYCRGRRYSSEYEEGYRESSRRGDWKLNFFLVVVWLVVLVWFSFLFFLNS